MWDPIKCQYTNHIYLCCLATFLKVLFILFKPFYAYCTCSMKQTSHQSNCCRSITITAAVTTSHLPVDVLIDQVCGRQHGVCVVRPKQKNFAVSLVTICVVICLHCVFGLMSSLLGGLLDSNTNNFVVYFCSTHPHTRAPTQKFCSSH